MEKQERTALAMVREALQTEADRVSFERAKQLAAEWYEKELYEEVSRKAGGKDDEA